MVTRDYRPQALKLCKKWRFWEAVWTWANVGLGGLSVATGVLVASNTKEQFLGKALSIAVAVAAPVLTFTLTAIKPQAKATAFKTASRELERALRTFECDTTKDDVFLGEAISRGSTS